VPVTPQQGRRWFRCDVCGNKWRRAHKAALSQSPEDCAQCGASVPPMHNEVDANVLVDAQGDLTAPELAEIRGGLRPTVGTANPKGKPP